MSDREVYDFNALVLAGLTPKQAAEELSKSPLTGHGGRPVVDRDALEMALAKSDHECRDVFTVLGNAGGRLHPDRRPN
jgi:hypothetical protein